ncbi:MAG: HD domain-containing protein [Eubacteriales bacterium]|nr:HD domain-containing protein [Eubacteriales bacterium]
MSRNAIVSSASIGGLIQRTLNRVDSRLVNHGIRVAFLVSGMLRQKGGYSPKEYKEQCLTAILHDIGAYKTEEIDKMLDFECDDIWEHSIYGYLFLRYLSPLSRYAEAVLYHHTNITTLSQYDVKEKDLAQMIHIADRVDIFWESSQDKDKLLRFLKKSSGTKFSPEIVDLFLQTEASQEVLDNLMKYHDLNDLLDEDSCSDENSDDYLKMLIYSIDFRSEHTVTHTITTTFISRETARLMKLPSSSLSHIYYGALLHDLGKIGIPVEILEFPGKLSPQAMTIMRTHVDITEEILNGTIDSVTTNIALRHHEKLDGTGYPRGIDASDLTLEEQIVGISDMVSALIGTRSYKKSFSKERTLSILKEQAEDGKINKEIVNMMEQHFDEILEEVNRQCSPIIKVYRGIKEEYDSLLAKYKGCS